ncbi:hypothetical protein O181_018979 [Austropuccinia psidii MF-1]|uniref:Uncharacterized protein n=1 Tax=Austropuccinia psidii MF-1 TaxID=1389203 RepID=A0A9Q3C674_9BASI|nr:hypothetical protein [Austropuccinia psidii MF-1]
MQIQGQKDEELVENRSSLSVDKKMELEMTPALEKEGPEASICSRTTQRQAQRTSEEAERSQKNQGKGEGKENWQRPYPKGYRISKLGPSAMDSALNFAKTLIELTEKEKERMNQNFPFK